MRDSADVPLMGEQEDDSLSRHDEDTLSRHDDVEDDYEAIEIALQQPGPYMWALTFSAGISGLLFGCKCLNNFMGLLTL
jgi:hypothetical protein